VAQPLTKGVVRQAGRWWANPLHPRLPRRPPSPRMGRKLGPILGTNPQLLLRAAKRPLAFAD